VKPITSTYPVPRLRMKGAMPQIPRRLHGAEGILCDISCSYSGTVEFLSVQGI
jgi:hypothetical protein